MPRAGRRRASRGSAVVFTDVVETKAPANRSPTPRPPQLAISALAVLVLASCGAETEATPSTDDQARSSAAAPNVLNEKDCNSPITGVSGMPSGEVGFPTPSLAAADRALQSDWILTTVSESDTEARLNASDGNRVVQTFRMFLIEPGWIVTETAYCSNLYRGR